MNVITPFVPVTQRLSQLDEEIESKLCIRASAMEHKSGPYRAKRKEGNLDQHTSNFAATEEGKCSLSNTKLMPKTARQRSRSLSPPISIAAMLGRVSNEPDGVHFAAWVHNVENYEAAVAAGEDECFV